MRVLSLGREDPLQEDMATRSSILGWRNPSTEEPGGLRSLLQGLQSGTTERFNKSRVVSTVLMVLGSCLPGASTGARWEPGKHSFPDCMLGEQVRGPELRCRWRGSPADMRTGQVPTSSGPLGEFKRKKPCGEGDRARRWPLGDIS